MKVSRITIKNILGIEHMEIEPGALTIIEGHNGAGKTSVLAAISAAFEGGHDATLIRQGAASGESVLLLDDETTIRKHITADASKLTVEHPLMGKISKAQTFIKGLTNALALNPIEFLLASGKARTEMLLRAVPLKITGDDIAELTGDPAHARSYSAICSMQHPLIVLDEVEKGNFDNRTGVNRALKEKRATIEQLTATLPPPAKGGEWSARVDDLQEEINALTAEHTAAIAAVDQRLANAKHAAESTKLAALTPLTESRDAEIASIRKWEADEIARIKLRATAKVEQATQDHAERAFDLTQAEEQATAAAEAIAKAEHAEVAKKYEGQHAALNAELGEARANADANARAEQTRAIVAQMQADADKLQAETDRLTAVIGKVRDKKVALTKSLPISGLEIKDGELYLDGIPFDRVNESRRVRTAIEAAKLNAGKLGLICADGMERLDSTTFATFAEEAERCGAQLVVARVTDDPLTVRTFNGAEVDETPLTETEADPRGTLL